MAIGFEISPIYRRSLVVAVCVQVMLLILGILVPDLGEWSRAVLLAVVAFWVVTLSVLIRRPCSPTRLDLMFVQYGYPLIFVIFLFKQLLGV